MKTVSAHDRAVAIAHILQSNKRLMTTTQLASIFDCTPQTISNTLLRHGKKCGIKYNTVDYRPNAIRREFYYEQPKD